MNVHEITLDVSKEPAHEPSLYIAQGDRNGTTLKASIYDDGASLSLSGKSARFCMKAPKGAGYYEVNGTVSGNVATFQIDETYAAAIHGISEVAYVEILEGTTVICSTNRFRVVVLQSAQDGADPAQAWTNGVEEFLEDAQGQVDAAVDQAEDAAEDALEAAEEAREAAGGTIPLMSPIQRGGAKLGSGLSMDGEALNLGPLADSGSGASVQTDGCGIFGVQGEGWAEQDTTTGKNLLPILLSSTKVDSGITITPQADGSVRITGTSTAVAVTTNVTVHLAAGTYTLSKGTPKIENATGIQVDNGHVYANESGTFTVSSAADYNFKIRISSGVTIDETWYPQLEAGSTATSYEPYTGGKASPNPDYPQEIRVARGRNLVFKTIRGCNLYATGDIVTDISFSMHVAMVTRGAEYVITTKDSGNFVLIGFFTSEPDTGSVTYDNSRVILNSGTFIAPITGYVAFRSTIDFATPQLEKSSVATPYVPYGHIGLDITVNGQTTTTPIPLPAKGFLGALPDGTKDTLTIDSAGGVVVENATNEITFDGGSGESWNQYNNGMYSKMPNAATIRPILLSDKFAYNSSPSSGSDGEFIANGTSDSWNGNVTFWSSNTTSFSVWRTWLASNPVTVLYPIATPTTESLGYIDLPELPAGATVSIPELEAIGVEWWVEGAEAIAEHGRDVSRAAHELSEKLSTLEAAVATLATS